MKSVRLLEDEENKLLTKWNFLYILGAHFIFLLVILELKESYTNTAQKMFVSIMEIVNNLGIFFKKILSSKIHVQNCSQLSYIFYGFLVGRRGYM